MVRPYILREHHFLVVFVARSTCFFTLECISNQPTNLKRSFQLPEAASRLQKKTEEGRGQVLNLPVWLSDFRNKSNFHNKPGRPRGRGNASCIPLEDRHRVGLAEYVPRAPRVGRHVYAFDDATPRGCVGYRHGVLVRARHPAGLRERRARLATPATPHVLWMRPPPDLPRIPEALVSPRRVAFRGGYSSWSGRIWNTDSGRFSGSSKFEQVPERSACRAIYRSRRVKPEKRPNCEIFCCPANSSPLSTRNHGALVGAR